jgi:hypothetical protein
MQADYLVREFESIESTPFVFIRGSCVRLHDLNIFALVWFNRRASNLYISFLLRIDMEKQTETTIEDFAVYCKRRGFVYPSGELYGGMAGFWDFGPVGVEFLNNLKKEWWKTHIQKREDMVGIDGAIVTNPKVWGGIRTCCDVLLMSRL